MPFKRDRFYFILAFLIFCCLSSCGKVVQNVSEDKEKEETFKLTMTFGPVSLEDVADTKNENNNLISVKSDVTYKDKIYLCLKGYEESKVKNLAYSTATLSIEEKKLPIKKSEANEFTIKKIYTANLLDSSKVKVAKAKKSQFSGKFTDQTKLYSFETPFVSKEYDFYVVAAYKNEAYYRMKLIDQAIVSNNKTVDVKEMSKYDTFKALVFMMANRKISNTSELMNALDVIFDEVMFNELNLSFPKLEAKYIYKKQPVFKFIDPLIESCIDLIDITLIDVEEAKFYIQNNQKKIFSEAQIELLINKIEEFRVVHQQGTSEGTVEIERSVNSSTISEKNKAKNVLDESLESEIPNF